MHGWAGLWGVIVGLSGCADPGGTAGTDDSAAAGPSTGSTTGDSAIPEEGEAFTRFTISAEIAFDGTGPVTAQAPGAVDVLSMIYVTVASPTWDGSFSSLEACHFVFPLTGGTFRAEVFHDPRLWWGVSWNAGASPVIDTCEEQGIELGAPWTVDIIASIKSQSHWAAVGERTKLVDAALQKQKGLEDYVGGQLSPPFSPFEVDGTLLTAIDEVYTVAYRLDEDDALVVDGRGFLVPMAAGEVWDGKHLARGYYWLRPLSGWTW